MKKYRVWAKNVGHCYLDVYAKSEDDAKELAENTDGGDFIEESDIDTGYFEIFEVEEIEE